MQLTTASSGPSTPKHAADPSDIARLGAGLSQQSPTTMNRITFTASVVELASRLILQLPDNASKELPSRGQVAVQATVNGIPFPAIVEPDGDFGHWMNLERGLFHREPLSIGSRVEVSLEPLAEWPKPDITSDLNAALETAPETIRNLSREITPMARWEWVRWVKATRNTHTRARRVEVTISKLEHGKRRPCCFNLASCTDSALSRSGKLIKPTKPDSNDNPIYWVGKDSTGELLSTKYAQFYGARDFSATPRLFRVLFFSIPLPVASTKNQGRNTAPTLSPRSIPPSCEKFATPL